MVILFFFFFVKLVHPLVSKDVERLFEQFCLMTIRDCVLTTDPLSLIAVFFALVTTGTGT